MWLSSSLQVHTELHELFGLRQSLSTRELLKMTTRESGPDYLYSKSAYLRLYFRFLVCLISISSESRKLHCLDGDSDNTAGRAGTSVASLEGLLGVALAKIVSASVDDNCALQAN